MDHIAVHTPLWSCRAVSAQREQLAARVWVAHSEAPDLTGCEVSRQTCQYGGYTPFHLTSEGTRVGVSSATRHNQGRDNQGDIDRQRHRVIRASVRRVYDTSDGLTSTSIACMLLGALSHCSTG